MPQIHEEGEQEQQPLPNMGGAYLPSAPDDDFFKYRIDGSDILEDIKHQLMGEIYNFETKSYVQAFEPWINKDGANKVLHTIYSCGINKNSFLGNLKTEEIKRKCESLWKDVAYLIYKKGQDYGVKKEMRGLLIKSVIYPIHSGLSRSEGGKEAHQISTASQQHYIHSLQENQKQKSGMSLARVMGRGRMGKGTPPPQF